MKKFLALSLSVLAGVTLGILILGFSLHVRAGAPVEPMRNGDVNGDGTIDISDVVYTLLYLFQSGSPPVACAQDNTLTPEQVEILSHLSLIAAKITQVTFL